MNLQVTSVSAKEQKLSRTPAAVYVITAEDIRRSGAATIPDLLRLVPGVDVEQINANSWALSIRGFADRYSNKVLVLIDGRSVYSPLYSGVVWSAVDVPLEDIDRIEVIRGPGGTVWGANAVNGVINILTKPAGESQGGLVSVTAGSELQPEGLIRYGGKIGRTGAYRLFGKYFRFATSEDAGKGYASDGWHLTHGGFRSDWGLSDRDALTVQADYQQTLAGQRLSLFFADALPLETTFQDRITNRAANILGRWTHHLANGSEMTWQFYDDYLHQEEQGLRYTHNSTDATFQHHAALGSRQDVVWGLGFRSATSILTPGYALSVDPPRKTDRLFSIFVQDEIRVARHVWLTAGAKFEHNDYTGFEWEPSAQVLWSPDTRHSAWFSVARAIRQPTRTDAGVQYTLGVLPGSPLTVLQAIGNRSLQAEKLHDLEAGYRAQLRRQLSLDVAVFSGFYRDLLVSVPQSPYFTPDPAPPHVVLPLQLENGARAHSYGAEIFLNSSITSRWRISPGYSLLHVTVKQDPSVPASAVTVPTNSPEHQFQFRSFLNLPHNLEWDHTLTYVGGLKIGKIPAYARLDSRFGWRIGESLEATITAQNITRPRHFEFPDEFGVNHTQIERSVFGKIVWHF